MPTQRRGSQRAVGVELKELVGTALVTVEELEHPLSSRVGVDTVTKAIQRRQLVLDASAPRVQPRLTSAHSLSRSRVIDLAVAPLLRRLLGVGEQHLARNVLARAVHLPQSLDQLGLLFVREHRVANLLRERSVGVQALDVVTQSVVRHGACRIASEELHGPRDSAVADMLEAPQRPIARILDAMVLVNEWHYVDDVVRL